MREEDTRPPLPGAGVMENYTNPFLVVAGVLCFIILLVIWANFGLLGAILTGLAGDAALRRSEARNH